MYNINYKMVVLNLPLKWLIQNYSRVKKLYIKRHTSRIGSVSFQIILATKIILKISVEANSFESILRPGLPTNKMQEPAEPSGFREAQLDHSGDDNMAQRKQKELVTKNVQFFIVRQRKNF